MVWFDQISHCLHLRQHVVKIDQQMGLILWQKLSKVIPLKKKNNLVPFTHFVINKTHTVLKYRSICLPPKGARSSLWEPLSKRMRETLKF